MGWCYEMGVGVLQDYKEAITWYLQAAERGVATAQFNLAKCYAEGSGITKDEKEAVKWYRAAAEQGDADALYKLGCCYDRGKGVPKNKNEAAEYYRSAISKGSKQAQKALQRLLSSNPFTFQNEHARRNNKVVLGELLKKSFSLSR